VRDSLAIGCQAANAAHARAAAAAPQDSRLTICPQQLIDHTTLLHAVATAAVQHSLTESKEPHSSMATPVKLASGRQHTETR
jgi:hypothetical protein